MEYDDDRLQELGANVVGLRYDKTEEFLHMYTILLAEEQRCAGHGSFDMALYHLGEAEGYFSDIWNLCERHMDTSVDDPKHPTHLATPPSLAQLAVDLSKLDHARNALFIDGMYNACAREREGDARRGRKQLSEMLYHAEEELGLAAYELREM